MAEPPEAVEVDEDLHARNQGWDELGFGTLFHEDEAAVWHPDAQPMISTQMVRVSQS